jgi:arylsulfatase A-like enzyme
LLNGERVNQNLNRRDFLKLAGLLPSGLFVPKWMRGLHLPPASDGKNQNIIVLIFDALSAYDVPLFGYQRQTTPNIARLSKRAIVYHNHFSAGNFTVPGTASLLTGALPWSHRALNLGGKVQASYTDKSIFHAVSDYYGIAYTHNGYANNILKQFSGQLKDLIPRDSLFLETYDKFISSLFEHDQDIASVSWIRGMQLEEEGSAYSLFLSHLYEYLQEQRIENLKPRFPRGIPTAGEVNPFLLETAIDNLGKLLPGIPQPFLGYFHFLPPHHPYRTEHQFFNAFKEDGVKIIEKPTEILAKVVKKNQVRTRTEYDEYILYCDQEFNRFYNYLETSGLLENTWLILTSDHGEMFERGIDGHGSKVLYQPVVRVPLIIFEPGRQQRMDVYDYTSAVDILPTLTYLAGKKLPEWTEGKVLPPFAEADSNRSVYSVQALDNAPQEPLTQASIIQVKEDYKLHYYFGYPELSDGETVKLFNIKDDPEELNDLYTTKKSMATELLDELRTKLQQVNKPYAV